MNGDPLSMDGRPMPAVAKLSDLAPAKLKLVRAGHARIAVTMIDGAVHAVAATCTHARILLAPGQLTIEGLIECPMHGALFSPIDGAVRCAPATEPLAVHEVRVIGDVVHVDPGPAPAAAAPAITLPGARPSAGQWGNWG
jgi:3-phenylpropionate/trans-cinnamate dioxygenase ferredoxin subunit